MREFATNCLITKQRKSIFLNANSHFYISTTSTGMVFCLVHLVFWLAYLVLCLAYLVFCLAYLMFCLAHLVFCLAYLVFWLAYLVFDGLFGVHYFFFGVIGVCGIWMLYLLSFEFGMLHIFSQLKNVQISVFIL